MNRRDFLLASAAVGATALAGCVAPFDLSSGTANSMTAVVPGTTLRIANRNGRVRLSRIDGDHVRVDVRLRSRSLGDDIGRVSVESHVERYDDEPGRMIVETQFDRDSIGREPRVTVDMEIGVPEFVVLEHLETTNGDLSVFDTAGDAELRTDNGRIEVARVDGVLTLVSNNGDVRGRGVTGIAGARTRNGSVDVEVAEVGDDATLQSTNGDVTLRVPTTVDATAVLRTTNGDAAVLDLPFTTTRDERRRIEGRIGDGGPRIELVSTNGDVTLRAV